MEEELLDGSAPLPLLLQRRTSPLFGAPYRPSSAFGIPKRDRSRSLVVDRVTPLITIDQRFLDVPSIQRGMSGVGGCCNARRRSVSSSSTDLVSRRGVFSRRHYGSVELLAQCELEGAEHSMRRFRVECGDRIDKDDNRPLSPPPTPVLENPEYQTRWYFKYFLGKLHQNYVGTDADKNPFFLSVVITDANDQCVPQYRAILWKKTGTQKICLSYASNKPMTVKQLLSNFSNMEKLDKNPKEIFAPEIQKDLLLLEEQEGSVNFKFGVLYAKKGQTLDDEMYSNETGSEEFENFIYLLGDRIVLKGWDKYRGGLDVKGDMTGEQSVYTIYEGHEIMFHVSTMLPHSKDNKQQVERKRHIGNDIVNMVFIDGDFDDQPLFKPSMVKSQFTHIFAVVNYNKVDDSYRLGVYSEESVPLFGPTLPSRPLFHNHQEFREFLLVKLINGEKAAFNTPTFAQKRERTLEMLIKDLYAEYTSETRSSVMLNRRAFSDVLSDPPKGGRRKEEARQVEFVRIGQALKLDTIMKGDAPTSLATTSLFKREPWEPLCFYPDFPTDIICGDSLDDTKLVLATENGVYVADDGMSHRVIFDKTVIARQLNVVEAHGILLMRVEKGRDSKVYVFRLSDFENEHNTTVRNKDEIKDHKLERTKGCHMYALSRPGGSHLRMVVAVGKKLLVLQWRHSAAWTAFCSSSDKDTVEGFQFIRELPVAEPPLLMTLVDCPNSGGDNQVCVGFKHQFDLINEKNGDTLRLHQVEGNKQIHLVAAVDVYEDEEAELLLCYNHTCHFQKLTDENSTEFDFIWNSVPETIVCAFPYILAFTTDSIEIRLIINGNLVQTMVMPKLRLITAKNDIYFATTAPEFLQVGRDRIKSEKLERDPSLSPPPSPHSPNLSPASSETKPLRIYKISFDCLTGGISCCERRVPTPSTPTPQSLGDRSGGSGSDDSSGALPLKSSMHLRVDQRPERGSRSGPSSPTPGINNLIPHVPPSPQRGLSKEQDHSASSDSGLGKSLGSSPSASPCIFSESAHETILNSSTS